MSIKKVIVYFIIAVAFCIVVVLIAPDVNGQPGSWTYTTMNSERWNDEVDVPNEWMFGNLSVMMTEGIEIVSYTESSDGVHMVLGIDPALLPPILQYWDRVLGVRDYLTPATPADDVSMLERLGIGDSTPDYKVDIVDASPYVAIEDTDGWPSDFGIKWIPDGALSTVNPEWNLSNFGNAGNMLWYTYDGILPLPRWAMNVDGEVMQYTGGLTVNNAQNDSDTIIKSDNYPDAIEVDAGLDQVTLGCPKNYFGDADTASTTYYSDRAGNYTSFTSATPLGADFDNIWPPDYGNPGDAIQTDGAGTWTWNYNYSDTYQWGEETLMGPVVQYMYTGGLSHHQAFHHDGLLDIVAFSIETWIPNGGPDDITFQIDVGPLGAAVPIAVVPYPFPNGVVCYTALTPVVGCVDKIKILITIIPVDDPDIIVDISASANYWWSQ